jgi:FtsZ-interacting cell division protein YlmF
MSKFLNLCNKIENILNEQDEQMQQQSPVPDQSQQPEAAQTEKPVEQQEPKQSELPIVSNDEIAELANSMKIFYQNPNSKLKDADVKEILALNPRDSKESEDIVKIIKTLKSIFNPVAIKAEPEQVKPSTDV